MYTSRLFLLLTFRLSSRIAVPSPLPLHPLRVVRSRRQFGYEFEACSIVMHIRAAASWYMNQIQLSRRDFMVQNV